MTSSTRHYTLGRLATSSGFGLMELLVSISIMIIVTGIVLTQHSSFNSGTLLRSQAYDIGLRLREVQLAAVSASAQGPGGTADFQSLFGARFLPGGGGYTVFSTPPVTGNLGAITQIGPDGIIDKRFEITCIESLPSASCINAADNIYIVFKRPNFDARFYDDGKAYLDSSVTGIRIHLGLKGTGGASRQLNNERSITITSTGQISVQ